MQNSCDFEPTGVNFVKVDSTANIGPLITEGSLNQDTIIYVSKTTDSGLKFKFSLKEKILEVKFYQNGHPLVSYYGYNKLTDSGTVRINFSPDSAQVHNLYCKIICRKGTGSMANDYDKEITVIEKNWTLITISLANSYVYNDILMNNLNVDVMFHTFYCSPSLLKNFLFQGFYLIKNTTDTVAFTSEFTQRKLTDTTYFGERAEYTITAKILNKFYTFNSKLVPQEITPEYLISYSKDDTYKVKFIKHKYFEKLDSVYFNLYFDNELIGEYAIDLKKNDFLILNNLNRDIDKYTFSFYCRSKLNTSSLAQIGVSDKKLLNNFVQCEKFVQAPNNELFCITNNQSSLKLKCFDTKEKKFIWPKNEQIYSYYSTISPLGKCLVTFDGDKRISGYNPKNFDRIFYYLFYPSTPLVNSISISDNNILAYTLGERDGDIFLFYFHDMIQQKYTNKLMAKSSSLNNSGFSMDGKYFFAGQSIFDIDGSEPVLINNITSGSIYSFDFDNPDNIYVIDENQIKLTNIKTNLTIRTICSLNDFMGIDIYNHYFTYSSFDGKTGEKFATILDTRSWDVLFKIKIRNTDKSVFFYNTLFYSDSFLPFE